MKYILTVLVVMLFFGCATVKHEDLFKVNMDNIKYTQICSANFRNDIMVVLTNDNIGEMKDNNILKYSNNSLESVIYSIKKSNMTVKIDNQHNKIIYIMPDGEIKTHTAITDDKYGLLLSSYFYTLINNDEKGVILVMDYYYDKEGIINLVLTPYKNKKIEIKDNVKYAYDNDKIIGHIKYYKNGFDLINEDNGTTILHFERYLDSCGNIKVIIN